MIIHRTGQKAWTNRHETFTQPIDNLYDLGNENTGSELADYNDATAGIQRLIAEAIDSGKELRALGGEWSWTKVAATTGVLLNTKPLNLSFRLNSANVSPAYAKTPDDLYFAQCGVSVKELNNRLRARQRSLRTTGASNGQTIAGALSTGTHGAAIDVGAIPDFVVGLHLITGPSKHIWLERKSYPVIADAFATRLQTEIVRDDALFNAALVSFGSFGVIHGVMLETDPLFLYEAHRVKVPVNDALFRMMKTFDFGQVPLPCGTERPYHFQVMINPYDADQQAYINVMYKRNFGPYPPFPPFAPGLGPGDDAPSFIGRLTDAVPALVPTLVNNLLAASIKPYNNLVGIHAEFFNNTSILGKVMSTAAAFPASEVERMTHLMLKLNKEAGPFPGAFFYRFVKGSGATLGFTRFQPTCVLELDGVFSEGTTRFYEAFWDMLLKENIPHAFHWGKQFEADGHRIRLMYGNAAVDSWLAARHAVLENDACEKVFTNDLLRRWELDKLARLPA